MNKNINGQFGKYTSLKPVITIDPTTTTTTTINQSGNNKEEIIEDDSSTNKTTDHNKILRITPNTFERLRQYSARNHSKQPISYDEIFNELLDFYNEKNETKYNTNYFHLSRI